MSIENYATTCAPSPGLALPARVQRPHQALAPVGALGAVHMEGLVGVPLVHFVHVLGEEVGTLPAQPPPHDGEQRNPLRCLALLPTPAGAKPSRVPERVSQAECRLSWTVTVMPF